MHMPLEATTRARRVSVATSAQRRLVDLRHEVQIGERVFAGAERFARCLALEIPFELRHLARAPECPDVMKLERAAASGSRGTVE